MLMHGITAHRERGDTLIEVIFSTAVLALVIVLAISIMNSGTGQAERAVEGTFVRQQIDTQTEMLRYLRDSYLDKTLGASPNAWDTIKDLRSSSVPAFSTLAGDATCKPADGEKAFYLATEGGSVVVKDNGGDFATPTTYAAAGQGLWIEATPSSGVNYIDFYIYACWNAATGGGNSTTGTIVRLYVP